MQRSIVGFHRDSEGYWVADLNCAHGQHMRHDPPFFERTWVLTEAGRNSRIGQELECLKCDQFEWPENLVSFQKMPEFDEQSIPKGLLKDHATKAGVWGKIILLEGSLLYRPEALQGKAQTLTPLQPGIVVPEMKHEVQLNGPVRFYVEFYRKSS